MLHTLFSPGERLAAPDCAGAVRSVCYVLIDGAGAFCAATETLDSAVACGDP